MLRCQQQPQLGRKALQVGGQRYLRVVGQLLYVCQPQAVGRLVLLRDVKALGTAAVQGDQAGLRRLRLFDDGQCALGLEPLLGNCGAAHLPALL